MPGAQHGIMAPYQEKPQVHPLELKLHYDPKRDGNHYYPLLMAVGRTPESATKFGLSVGEAPDFGPHGRRKEQRLPRFRQQ